MTKLHCRCIDTVLWCILIPLGFVAATALLWGADRARATDGSLPETPAAIMAQKRSEVDRQVLGVATQVFEPSLEMKENVDFLLTPALLLQEAMSEDILLTYPSE